MLSNSGYFVGQKAGNNERQYVVTFYDALPNEIPSDSIIGKYNLARTSITFEEPKPERHPPTPEERIKVTAAVESVKAAGIVTFTVENVQARIVEPRPPTDVVRSTLNKMVRDGHLHKPERGMYGFVRHPSANVAAKSTAGSRGKA